MQKKQERRWTMMNEKRARELYEGCSVAATVDQQLCRHSITYTNNTLYTATCQHVMLTCRTVAVLLRRRISWPNNYHTRTFRHGQLPPTPTVQYLVNFCSYSTLWLPKVKVSWKLLKFLAAELSTDRTACHSCRRPNSVETAGGELNVTKIYSALFKTSERSGSHVHTPSYFQTTMFESESYAEFICGLRSKLGVPLVRDQEKRPLKLKHFWI